jgi:hypothetical protein
LIGGSSPNGGKHELRNDQSSGLEAHHEEAEQATDETTYRTWRLFMAGSAHQFSSNETNVYQSLLVKPDEGRSSLPLTRGDWYREKCPCLKLTGRSRLPRSFFSGDHSVTVTTKF